MFSRKNSLLEIYRKSIENLSTFLINLSMFFWKSEDSIHIIAFFLQAMVRINKKRGQRLLDGRAWDDMPDLTHKPSEYSPTFAAPVFPLFPISLRIT